MIPTFRALCARSLFVGHSGPSIVALAAACLALSPGSAIGQNTFPQSGNVGIGTPSPGAPLDVVMPSGGFGAIFEAPGNPLVGVFDTAVNSRVYLAVAEGPGSWLNYASAKDGLLFSSAGGLGFGTSTYVRMYVNSAGNVGTGTTNPQQLLDVASTMAAREIIVTQTGADYVFDPAYRLAPLGEVADYIKENHHLPDVPSAQEMQENGASVGEMQAKLLAKVEELTLHLIQADERNTAADERNYRLEQQNRDLQERIAKLEALAAAGGAKSTVKALDGRSH